jgi:hypothetical protein
MLPGEALDVPFAICLENRTERLNFRECACNDELGKVLLEHLASKRME